MAWNRRKFIKAGVWSAIGLGLIDSLWVERYFIETKKFSLEKFGDKESGIKVVQVSDLHLRKVSAQIRNLAKELNTLKPDLILLTGDSVDKAGNVHLLREFLNLIDKSVKKVAILGNWEYWGNVNLEDLRSVYSENNCDLLINDSKQYRFRAKTVSITGVDDFIGGHSDIELALKQYSPSDYHIVLNHCPQYSDAIFDLAPAAIPIDLMLSGHTHGGQINLLGFAPFTPRGSGRYLKGWYGDGTRKLYVSKGIGTSILPMRFMARAEIAVFHIA